MRFFKGVALVQFGIAAGLVVLAIRTANWAPFTTGTVLAHAAALLWQDAKHPRVTVAAGTPQLLLLFVGTPVAVGGLLAIPFWVDSEFWRAVNWFALLLVVATAGWCAVKWSRPKPTAVET